MLLLALLSLLWYLALDPLLFGITGLCRHDSPVLHSTCLACCFPVRGDAGVEVLVNIGAVTVASCACTGCGLNFAFRVLSVFVHTSPRYVLISNALMPTYAHCHFGLKGIELPRKFFSQPSPPSNDARASCASLGFESNP